ncbi:MAG: DUF1854 domain-containing protein [Cellulosilyticaceae bacterium]
MDQITYVTPDTYTFYETEGGFLGLKSEEKDYGRVSVLRAFPLSHETLYLSIRDSEQNEIGMIRDLAIYEGEQKGFIEAELERRYFLPSIQVIDQVKQDFGYYHWEVNTDRGHKSFISRKDNSQVIQLPNNRVIVLDVDGNRYEIKNAKALDPKSFKQIELLL